MKPFFKSTLYKVKTAESHMIHELRTPMNGVLGMATVLLDTELDDIQRDCVETIIHSGDAMLSLVNDILDLSKIEAGFVSFEKSQFELNALIHEVCQSLQSSILQKKLDLTIVNQKRVPLYLFHDRAKIRQVLLNLIENAVKFTQEGFVKVITDFENDLLCIDIIDSGIGMNAQTISQIFSPFVQGDSSMTKKFEGTGLVLAITKNIVHAMGGQIQVTSEVDQGSHFKIQIPIPKMKSES